MNIKESLSEYFKISELKEHVTTIIESKVEIKKLEIQEKIEAKLAKLAIALLFGTIAFMAFIVFNLLIIKFIDTYSESNYLGETIFLLIYLLIGTAIYFNKDAIKKKLSERIAEGIDND